MLFGVLGTIISFSIISFGVAMLFNRIGVTSLTMQDYLAIGAILSATDSVCTLQVLNQDETPLLYSLVFGEGVVNDATSIVLFNAVQTLDFKNLGGITALKLLGNFLYLFFTSTVLGIAAGLLSAYLIKTLYFGRHSTDRESAIMMLMAYLSYMLAELFGLSGILTIFFCGVVMSHYTWHNITESSRITTRHAFAMISFIAETFIFLYLGMDTLDVNKWKNSNARAASSAAVSSTMLALVLLGRAAFIFPITNIMNCIGKRGSEKIVFRQQFVIWWAGLMRGAVTIALSYSEFAKASRLSSEDGSFMITTTMIIVLFSTVVSMSSAHSITYSLRYVTIRAFRHVFGSITKPLIEAVLLRQAKGAASDAREISSLEDLTLLLLENGDHHDSKDDGPRRSSLSLFVKYPGSSVHYLWRSFDDKFMRPVFGGRGFGPSVPRSQTGETEESGNNS